MATNTRKSLSDFVILLAEKSHADGTNKPSRAFVAAIREIVQAAATNGESNGIGADELEYLSQALFAGTAYE